ncbi:hypothetical protein Ancab_011171, partial [Ancistrocladus abbreviatus]
IYCPPRMDRYSNRFGFVRFIDIQNQVELVHQLDGIWIGGQKLSVKVAKSREFSTYLAHDRQQDHFIRNMSVVRKRTWLSFAEVVRRVKTLRPSNLQPSQSIPQSMGNKEQVYHSIIPSSSRKELLSNKGVIYQDETKSVWLKDCLVGECFFVE